MTSITRRRSIELIGSGIAASGISARAATLTAEDIIRRIKERVGVPWREQTVDTFKAGKPQTAVKGIATSFAGTFDVIKRASTAGANLVIVHEPTFYNHEDQTQNLSGFVYQAKQDFIAKHDVVVWRFHDHWHARRPDGVLAGMVEELGWEKYRSTERPNQFAMPETALASFARGMKDRMKIRAIRVIGDPKMKISNVVLGPGYNNLQGMMRTLERDGVDAMVIGECREWEGVEYVQDAITAGRKKALIILGHVPSEEGGMKECSRWLKTFVSEVPIHFVPTGEPFWTP